MRGSRIFCQGRGVQARRPEYRLDNFFLVLNLFYSLQMGQMVLLQRKLYFSKDPEWVQHFPGGGQLFPGGGGGGIQKLISIETYITCDFPGGPDPPPPPPLDPHMQFLLI